MTESTPEHEPADVEAEDAEPLADKDMTDEQPAQGRSQDDPALGATPEVDDTPEDDDNDDEADHA